MKMKLPLSIVVAFFLFGCKSTTAPTSTPVYFFVGDSSIYSNQAYDVNGQTGSTTYDTISVVSINTIDGKSQLILSNGTIVVLTANGGGTIARYTEDDLMINYIIPSKAGDLLFEDSVPTKIGGVPDLARFRVTAGNPDTVITVPGGIFHSAVFVTMITFKNDLTDFTTGKLFISPADGLIQRETFTTDSTTKKLYLANLSQLTRLIKKK